MNFNASRNVGPGGIRKAKRVSDVAAMGAPSPPPAAPAAFVPHAPAAPAAPPPYAEAIQLDANQDFGAAAPAANFGYMGGFPQSPIASPAQIGSMLQQPVVQEMALEYSQQLAAAGGAALRRELGRAVPVSRLRYYFAVDTRYVLRKLLLICFPYTHKEWMVKYDEESPVQPRYDLNAPDLYIPCMGYVTYVLLAGFMLGLQHRFSPEQIGMQASSALAYLACELALYAATLQVTRTHARARPLDLLAHAGYKYVPMIASLLAGLALGRAGYYCALLYSSLALSYFLVKTLRLQILSGSQAPEQPAPAYGYAANPYAGAWGAPGAGAAPPAGGAKRRVYFLLFVAVTQPLLTWWLTYHLVPEAAAAPPLAPPLAPAR